MKVVFFIWGNQIGPTEILVKGNFRSEMNISKERENLRKKQCLIASAPDADLTIILRRNVEQEMRDARNYARVCKTTRVGMLVEPDNQQETIKPETNNLADNEQLYDIVDPDPYGIYINQEESELQYESYVMKRVILNGKSIKFVVDTGSPFTP